MFLTIIGIIVAVSLFLYFINIVDSGKQKIKELQETNSKKNITEKHKSKTGISEKTTGSKVHDLPDDLKNYMPGRRCPLCSRTLSRDEPLYASQVENFGEKKILIHGCPYCYKNQTYFAERDDEKNNEEKAI